MTPPFAKKAKSLQEIMEEIFEKMKPEEAFEILRYLAKSDSDTKEKILSVAEDIIRDVDVEEICDEVFFVLDRIDVHELWNRSGSTYDGYTSPEDMAADMLEEELDPFNQEVVRLSELNMPEEAKLYCMGVLKGIYKYVHESKSEFKGWAIDMPEECFKYLLDTWKKRCKNKKDIKEMNIFLEKECSNWANWAVIK